MNSNNSLQSCNDNSLHTEGQLWSDCNSETAAIADVMNHESIVFNLFEDIRCLKEDIATLKTRLNLTNLRGT